MCFYRYNNYYTIYFEEVFLKNCCNMFINLFLFKSELISVNMKDFKLMKVVHEVKNEVVGNYLKKCIAMLFLNVVAWVEKH